MKKLLPIVMLLMTAGAANAGGLVTKHASSVQLTVDAARTTATRVGNSYSVSGSGVVTDVGGSGTADLSVGGLGTLTNGVAGGSIPTATQSTSGNAFSFSQSFTAGDATITTAPTVGDVSAFSNTDFLHRRNCWKSSRYCNHSRCSNCDGWWCRF